MCQPGDEVLFDDKAISFPVVLSDLERGEYYVQAVWDRNLGGRAIAESPGNMYSVPMKITLKKDTGTRFNMVCDQVVAGTAFCADDFCQRAEGGVRAVYRKVSGPVDDGGCGDPFAERIF